MMPQFKVMITGVVQGVGFRPFVYRAAKKNNVRGFIRNAGNSVELFIQGTDGDIMEFLNTIKKDTPPLSRIKDISIVPINERDLGDFEIMKSEGSGSPDSVMPPDVSICGNCLDEIFDRTDRRYQYPFTVCTDCGPRFTIIRSLPYDRENTTMHEFGMCKKCNHEYLDPSDRRFHAEPVCCPECGPGYELFKGYRNTNSNLPIKDAALALDDGKIVAIKGIGGTHLCARIADDGAIIRMRRLLNRPEKPFAVMARDFTEAMKMAHISKKEEEHLSSPQRPIVLLKKKDHLSKYITPGLNTIGIMLPYSGMHHLLFHYSQQPALVMTSANAPGEPMAKDNEEILSLNADLSLVHNRNIQNRCDDSVIRFIDGSPSFTRRSRGFVPEPVEVKNKKKTILSLGAELDVTACLLKKDSAFMTQYIGNTTKLRTLEYLESSVHNLMELTRTEKLDAIAVDMHPLFNTGRLGTDLCEKFNIPLIKCQHHYAHAASLQAESGHERMVCITADGAGYGNDGTVWGGEIIAVDDGFERAGHFVSQLMPGGDLAARYPARMAMGILSRSYGRDELKELFSSFFKEDELTMILKQIEAKFNSPLTSSTGRILDSIAALLCVCTERTYEGEPAMKLEALAMNGNDTVDIPVEVNKIRGIFMLDTTKIIEAVLLARNEHSPSDIAASAQGAVAKGLTLMAIETARERKMDVIGFSGGVAYNDAIIRTGRKIAEAQGLKFITHRKVPCGDGGISLGQAVMAGFNKSI